MNYRHAFHAGNHADVLKHVALVQALQIMTRKPAPLAVLDTHAGIGLYDLTGEAAQRSPEWRDGVARLWALAATAEAPAAVQAWRAALSADATVYPGSPLLALGQLRADDRYIACELHPEDAKTLRGVIGGDARAHVHVRDGYEAATALVPFPERRGLVLIDPPYEASDDAARSVAAIRAVVKRFRQAVVLWWRPVKAGGPIDAADRELAQLGLEGARFDLAVDAPEAKGGLKASSVLVLNPPFGLAEEMDTALKFLTPTLAQGPGARYMVRRTLA
ncbi:MAG: 23S rRNA (adenine(2030)-N(6))-methyltransferase RlmJ [Alphaproteobacteria bacterium]|nr:23S rRNA (adenine(2030)-N(6))-methyltransferase RlmJ [Alphaproteobacteria bacterium]